MGLTSARAQHDRKQRVVVKPCANTWSGQTCACTQRHAPSFPNQACQPFLALVPSSLSTPEACTRAHAANAAHAAHAAHSLRSRRGDAPGTRACTHAFCRRGGGVSGRTHDGDFPAGRGLFVFVRCAGEDALEAPGRARVVELGQTHADQQDGVQLGVGREDGGGVSLWRRGARLRGEPVQVGQRGRGRLRRGFGGVLKTLRGGV